ncbi:MAG TPA: ribonuclease HII [Gaiellaceae bacterium]|nr:ribonuclease HII [Gaiellaceae bacterium]
MRSPQPPKLPNELPRARRSSTSRSPRSQSPPEPEATSAQTAPPASPPQRPRPSARASGRKLRSFDRAFGARFVAGADEAGRGSLAGPLLVAGVLFDYRALRGASTRPLALLNDSKQLTAPERERLFRAVVLCAERIVVRAFSPSRIDRDGLHVCNVEGLRAVLRALVPPAEICLVDGFRLGPQAPAHTAVVEGDERSAAIAAASIVAKVVRDRLMQRLDALYPAYGFASHVGYLTPEHSARVREHGPSHQHRRSFRALCYAV